MVNKCRPQKRVKSVGNEKKYNINEQIEASEIRLVGDNIQSRVCGIDEALHIAADMGLDLVEINSVVSPPVCKVVDYSKFMYQQKKIRDNIKSSGQVNTVKEIKIESNIGEHDMAFKQRHAVAFLEKGFSVRITLMLFGRTIMFKDEARKTLNLFIDGIKDYCRIKDDYKDEDKKISVLLIRKK